MPGTELTRNRRPGQVADLAAQLRVDAVRCTAAAGSGHPTSSLSAADLMAVLLTTQLGYDIDHPGHPGNDQLILSKGHASPLLYAALRAVGAIDEAELATYRRRGSRLEGHPTPRLPWVPVATGSLGQGLPVGVGVALAGARLERLDYRVWVLCGDGELAEGAMWEAFAHAGHSRLANLTAVIDVNRLGQQAATRWGWNTAAYAAQIRAFGWHTVEVDGHDPAEIEDGYAEAVATTDRPTAVLARTVKGRGAPEVEDQLGHHGKPLADADRVIAELGGVRQLRVALPRPQAVRPHRFPDGELRLPSYPRGELVATRDAFGAALTAVGAAHGDVVVLDGEVADSTRTADFAAAHPDRFFQCYIAEQQLVAAAVGMQTRGWKPYAATFAAFLSRAYDIVRMAAVSRADLRLVGSHAGVAIGEDGPSQMGLEDLAALRAVHGSTVLYPCDANQTARLTARMAELPGISYLRTGRGATPVIYDSEESFPVGGSRVLRRSSADQLTLVAAGVTVHEALAAAHRLADEGIAARVIDLYSVKPVDAATLRQAARETGCLLTVEDHVPAGGVGDAVAEAVADGTPPPRLRRLAVTTMPGSATPAAQLADAGIDAAAIVGAARALVAA